MHFIHDWAPWRPSGRQCEEVRECTNSRCTPAKEETRDAHVAGGWVVATPCLNVQHCVHHPDVSVQHDWHHEWGDRIFPNAKNKIVGELAGPRQVRVVFGIPVGACIFEQRCVREDCEGIRSDVTLHRIDEWKFTSDSSCERAGTCENCSGQFVDSKERHDGAAGTNCARCRKRIPV